MSPPVLSSLWFPVHERATATAIMATCNTLGTSVGYVTAFVVPSKGTDDEINAALLVVYWSMFGICIGTLVPNYMKSQLSCTLVFPCRCFNPIQIAVLIYFPDRPPTPPSASSSVIHVDIKKGIMQLIKHSLFNSSFSQVLRSHLLIRSIAISSC